jgi:hypothetical protein
MVETSVTNRSRASASVYTVCHAAHTITTSLVKALKKKLPLQVNEGGGTGTNLGDNTLKQLASLSIRRHATALRSAGAAF